MRLNILAVCLLLFVLGTSKVQAQKLVYVCPKGTVYTETFGYIECKPIGVNSKEDSMLSSAMAQSLILDSLAKDIDKNLKDPRRKEYLEGRWIFTGEKSNEFCSAMFSRKGVSVSVFQPGGNVPGAFLMFWGQDIPQPKKLTKIRATLSQTGDVKPQTVKVFNLTFTLNNKEQTKIGSLFFQVPKMEDALNNIENIHFFGVSIKSKKVAEIEWNNGFAARAKLRQCVEVRNKVMSKK